MIFDELKKPEDFDALQLKLASPEEILAWSYGEVTKPETINYRTQRAEKDGLFSEAIFGPEKDWECYCGKYRRIRYKGVICDRCGVEVTRSIVRRERMGHIKLAVSVSHIWFLRGVPSRIGLMLNISVQKLEKVIYFAAYIITKVNEAARQKAFKEIEKEYKTKLKIIRGREARKELKLARDRAKDELSKIKKMEIISELTFQQLSQKYSEVFSAGIGAEAIREILKEIDLDKLINELTEELKKTPPGQKKKILARLRLIKGLKRAGIRPEWMFLTTLPVMPPDLRPMVQLDGGRFATSDVNDLYRRVINRNNRLKRLLELNAPEVICRNEKRMLQEAVDALIDNAARRGQKAVMATTGQRRQLKSLADMLRGKQGRFRQNLLGKRVDYSGRSVIVVGPELKLYQCGIPKTMALELFKPFVINKLIERELVYNIRGARRLIEEGVDEVWAILEEVIERYYVLLNRAPTLHRLGVQAFRPVLIEGLAIQIHPMVCKAFNADFDGDQMAVHLPLSENAQKESREIMASAVNLFKPATGEAIVYPTLDMVLGIYFMTKIQDGLKGEGKVYASIDEAILAHQSGIIDLQAKIKISARDREKTLIETSAGRIIFNSILPEGMEFINKELNAKQLKGVTEEAIGLLGAGKSQEFLDKIKNLGFEYATKSGISWGMDDLSAPAEKYQIVDKARKEIDEVRRQYQEGLLTRVERKTKSVEIWANIKNKISDLVPKALDPYGPVNMIFSSGARGSWSIATQLVGMRGLVINPASEVIELPVISSLKEGFNVLEYFISTHGGRKGLADTALKTASAGYLTRRLVDVAQDVVIREEDCKDREGIVIYKRDLEDLGISLAERIIGRVSLEEVKNPKTKKIILKRNELINKIKAQEIEALGIDKLLVRSPISCKTRFGICKMCYGYDLGRNKLIDLGEAVGIVSAQAIGEPGTQLTLRTFHTGGVAGGSDITQGLPRVEEIFEARVPRGKAVISELTGKVVSIKEKGGQKTIKIQGWIEDKRKKRKAVKEYVISPQTGIWVQKEDSVTRGQQLCEGPVDLKEMFKLADKEAVQRYIIKEVQKIYSTQGGGLNDKHIEVIIHQMFSRVRIKDAGDTNLLAGAVIERDISLEENNRVKKAGKKPAVAQPLILGISKVALSTESFLSAASFIETVRVLIKAATEGKVDSLRGLKENVIIGKLIPAGTGFREGIERKEKK